MKKNILITGASGNLGHALVTKFSGQGDQVIATYSPGKVTQQTGVATYEADLTSEKSVRTVIDSIQSKHSTIDAAVLTVGGFAMGSLPDTNLEAVKKMLTINFDTAYNIIHAIFPLMMKQGGGRIILVGARPALQAEHGKAMVAYALSKSLIFQLAELVNAEGKDKQVVCSVIVPGTIDTSVNRAAMPNANFNEWVKPETIAETVAFLISDAGSVLREPVLKLYGNA